MFLTCIFVTGNMLAQDSPLRWGDPFRFGRGSDYSAVIGSKNGGFYTARLKDDKSEILLLDQYAIDKMGAPVTSEVTIPLIEEEPHDFAGIAQVKDGFILFTQAKNKKAGQYQFFASVLNFAGEPVYDPVFIHSIPTASYREEGRFEVRFSPDSSMFMVFYNHPFERKMGEGIDLRVYNMDYELLWSKNLEMPNQEGMVQLRNFMIDNNGDAFMMSGWAPEKSFALSKFQRPQDGRYVLFHYNWRQNKLKEYDVSLKNKSIVSVKLDITVDGDVVIAGFFSNDYLFSVSGTFLFTLDIKAGVVKTAAMVAFPKEFLSLFLSQRAVERGLDLSDFYLDYLHVNKNGETILVGERFYITERVITDPTTGRQTMDYIRNFDDILVVSLLPDGNIAWSSRVAKRQTTYGQGTLSSYVAFFTDENVRVYFNDDPDNIGVDLSAPGVEAKEYRDDKNSVVSEVLVSKGGRTLRKAISNAKETGYSLKPGMCSQSGAMPVILGFEESRSSKFAVLSEAP